MSVRKILVVDDQPDAADTTAEVLRCDEGNEVRVVYGGVKAVEAARTFRPDLVLLDINMPVMDGYEAAAALRREQPPDCRLILVALTGRTEHDDIERARRAGFDFHIGKPVMGATLCRLVASFLDEKSTDEPARSLFKSEPEPAPPDTGQ